MVLKLGEGGSIPPIPRATDEEVLGATTAAPWGIVASLHVPLLALNGARDLLGNPMRLETLSIGANTSLDRPEARPVSLLDRSTEGWRPPVRLPQSWQVLPQPR